MESGQGMTITEVLNPVMSQKKIVFQGSNREITRLIVGLLDSSSCTCGQWNRMGDNELLNANGTSFQDLYQYLFDNSQQLELSKVTLYAFLSAVSDMVGVRDWARAFKRSMRFSFGNESWL